MSQKEHTSISSARNPTDYVKELPDKLCFGFSIFIWNLLSFNPPDRGRQTVVTTLIEIGGMATHARGEFVVFKSKWCGGDDAYVMEAMGVTSPPLPMVYYNLKS
jgi:hypothetical protein